MMKSVTLLFPGQGSQYVGMGETLEGQPSKKFLEFADEALGYSISEIMLKGPEDTLKSTENAQPAILTYSIALFDRLWEMLLAKNIKVDRVMGHSVGEYAALVAAKVIPFEHAVRAVNKRGKYMQEAVPVGKGGMLAVLGSEMEEINSYIKLIKSNSACEIANDNAPGQIIVSGNIESIQELQNILKKNKKKVFCFLLVHHFIAL